MSKFSPNFNFNRHKNTDMISFENGTVELDNLREELYYDYLKNIIELTLKKRTSFKTISVFNESIKKLKHKIIESQELKLSFGKIKQLLNFICVGQIKLQNKLDSANKEDFAAEKASMYLTIKKTSTGIYEKIMKRYKNSKQSITNFEKKVETKILPNLKNTTLEKATQITLNVLKDSNSYQIKKNGKRQGKQLNPDDFLIITLHDLLDWNHDAIIPLLETMQLVNKEGNIRQKLNRAWEKLEVLVIDKIIDKKKD